MRDEPWRTVSAAGPMVTLLNTIQTYLNKLYCNYPDHPQPSVDGMNMSEVGAVNFSNYFIYYITNMTFRDQSDSCMCQLSDDGLWVPTATYCTARTRSRVLQIAADLSQPCRSQ